MKLKIAGILIYTAVWKESDTVSVNALLALRLEKAGLINTATQ